MVISVRACDPNTLFKIFSKSKIDTFLHGEPTLGRKSENCTPTNTSGRARGPKHQTPNPKSTGYSFTKIHELIVYNTHDFTRSLPCFSGHGRHRLL